MRIKRCEVCGVEFRAMRCTARFCSATCRKRYSRGYRFTGKLEAPKPNITMTTDEITDVVHRAHSMATDLSRASLMTSAPLAVQLRNAAAKINEALRGEGL